MPTVKYAVSAYTADGTNTDYLITWDYLDEDHIAVYVDGTSNADPTANHTFLKLNNTTLRITDSIGGAVVAGATIEIRRETPIQTRAITFADGSALLAEDLNKNSDYLLYSMQEVLDTVDAAAQDGAVAAEVATEALRDQAETHMEDAQAAQTASETARDLTQGYLATVQSDATDADNHRIAAGLSEAAALASEQAASASEGAALASEVASGLSEVASGLSEGAALASEVAAGLSEVAAAASEAAALASEQAALASKQAAADSLDSFTDRYLGAKSVVPTLDNDGEALITGAIYWNSVSDAMYVWNGSAWDTLPTSIGIADAATSTKVTITDTETTLNRLRVTATGDASLESTDHGIQIGDTAGSNIIIDTNEIVQRVNGVAGRLNLQITGGEVAFGGSTVDCSLFMSSTEFLDTDRNATFASVNTPDFKNTTPVSYYLANDGGTGNSAHLFYSGVGGSTELPEGGFYNNDFFTFDNISAGRVYRGDGVIEYNADTLSTVTCYSSDITTDYKNYTQILSRDSLDPDYGVFVANSAYVESETLDTDAGKNNAIVMDNGGRIWSWGAVYAGRTRRGDSSTTAYYSARDNSCTAYSNTGGVHGAGTFGGYTGITGRETANTDDVFIVFVAGQARIEFDAVGNGYFDGGADMGAADYAEYFEWEDGNPEDEDRRGYSVVLSSEGKMRIANQDDTDGDFLGIVSVEAAVVGDSSWAAWTGKYQRGKFGEKVKEKYTMYGWGKKENPEDQWEQWHSVESAALNGIEIPDDAVAEVKERMILSENYDPDREYIPRKDRVEWQAIGMLGKLPLYKGQPTKSTWRKLFDINDEVEMWLVR